MKLMIAVTVMILATGCSRPEPGLVETGLRPCPKRPNCVVSTGGDQDHSIAPIPYLSDRAGAMEKMKQIILKMDRTRIITEKDDYLHIECRSRVMGFVDDLELWFPRDRNLIHIRSASRMGYSDFGVNRARVDRIRAMYLGRPGQGE